MLPDTTSLMPDPHTIYQDWLDVTSAALMTNKPDVFVACLHLPFIMRTSTAETVLETVEDARSDAANVIQALKSQQVTHYVRLVKQARYLNEDTIEGWHSTYVLRHAASVTPTYSNRMILRRFGEDWKVCEADHELSGNRFPMTIMRSDPGSFEDVWAKAKADIRATHARAEPIYQAFIDSMSDVVNTPDFDAWSAHYTYPHEIHYDATDHTAHTPEDVRIFFELLTQQIHARPEGRMIRSARYAEFLSDDRIFGYHETIIVHGDETTLGPVKSRMMLTFEDGRWKCSSVTNSLSQQSPREDAFYVSTKLPTMREIQERMRK